jgi:hypothetical protein
MGSAVEAEVEASVLEAVAAAVAASVSSSCRIASVVVPLPLRDAALLPLVSLCPLPRLPVLRPIERLAASSSSMSGFIEALRVRQRASTAFSAGKGGSSSFRRYSLDRGSLSSTSATAMPLLFSFCGIPSCQAPAGSGYG